MTAMLTSVGCAIVSTRPKLLAVGARSPRKNSVCASAVDVRVPAFPGKTMLSADIEPGRAGQVLVLEGMLAGLVCADGGGVARPALLVRVNGVELEPAAPNGSFGASSITGPELWCTVTGAWRLDLDPAAESFPEEFGRQSLHIELVGLDYAGGGTTARSVVLRARLEKK